MTNQGRRGARAENHIADDLGGYGYDVIRSAASKGAADLVAVGDGFLVLVQVKTGRHGKPFAMPSPAERRELIRIAERLGDAVPVAACRVPGAGSRPAVTLYRRLTGPGPKDWRWWGPADHLRGVDP